MVRLTMAAIISFILISLIFAGISSAKIDPKTIVGIWLFDEGKGDIAKDSSGNKNDGTLMGNPKWVAGKFGKALEFDGTNGVQVDHSDELTLTSFTIAAWIKLEKGGAWQQVVTKPERNYSVGISPANLVECAFTVGGSYKTALGKTPVTDGEWHHVAGTYDMNFIRVYVDGVLEDEKPFTVTPDTPNNPVEIGSGRGEPIMEGIIDEVLISNTALTEDEIKKSMGGTAAVEPSGKLATTWATIKAQ